MIIYFSICFWFLLRIISSIRPHSLVDRSDTNSSSRALLELIFHYEVESQKAELFSFVSLSCIRRSLREA